MTRASVAAAMQRCIRNRPIRLAVIAAIVAVICFVLSSVILTHARAIAASAYDIEWGLVRARGRVMRVLPARQRRRLENRTRIVGL